MERALPLHTHTLAPHSADERTAQLPPHYRGPGGAAEEGPGGIAADARPGIRVAPEAQAQGPPWQARNAQPAENAPEAPSSLHTSSGALDQVGAPGTYPL
ncbi:hypothetical protein NDU88_007886 [Pleurodeles waltl]|uniref:Uncharacterized protein n=1 Tax=Pleurodeles waltl TaxID=8319 RepID=A0AAV7U1G7_PLEWA|nr:hypothetical protein NDU88_007886 [Pleurodeles waltl]